MRICIVYDSKRNKATPKIVAFLRKEIKSRSKHDVFIKKPHEVKKLSCNLLIIGSPIYFDKPLKSIEDFLQKNELKKKKVAIFVICIRKKIPLLGKFFEKRYLTKLKKSYKGKIIASLAITGWIFKENKKYEEECKKFVNEIFKVISKT